MCYFRWYFYTFFLFQSQENIQIYIAKKVAGDYDFSIAKKVQYYHHTRNLALRYFTNQRLNFSMLQQPKTGRTTLTSKKWISISAFSVSRTSSSL